MAEESKIFYRVIVHGEEGLATIQKMNGQFVKTKVPVENLNQELDKLNGTLSLTTSQAGRQMAKFKKLRGDVQINSKEYQNLTKSMRMYQKQIDMSTSSTGSASSAAMELGRVVSDMPYGIRGVANNLSQFASQMAYSAKQTGGLGFAIKDLFKALTGPLGVLLAIQAVISAFDYFAGGAKKAQKEVTDLTSKTYASSLVAKQYVKELEDVNLTEERRKVVTQELIKLVPTLKKEDLKYGENLDKVRLKISSYALAQASRIEIDKLVQENSKELASKNELESIKQIKNDEERISRMKKFILETGEDVSGFVLGFGDKAKIENEDINEIEETFKRLGKVIDKQSNPIMERIAELTKSLKLDPSKNGDDKGETKLLEFEPFEKTAERYEDELSKLNEQTELLDAKSEVEKLQIKKKYHLARLEAQHQEHIEKYEQTAAEYRADLELFFKQEVARTEMTQEDADKRLAIFDSNTKTQIRKSEESFGVLMDITKSYYNNRITEANFAGQKLIGDGKTQAQKEQEDLIKHLKSKADLYKSYSDKVKNVLSSIGDFVSAEFERELTIEENRNNEANKILNDRLLNENLSKDQRADIQKQIAQNDEKLRVKQEQIARKQFNVEKAFKIAMAIADTASSASKAYASQLSIPTPDAPIRAAAAAKVAIAFGLAQVAMIARTKFKTAAPSKPANASLGSSGGGGTTERAEPSFNVVGGSRENQLLTAIQSQFDKPLKAYVVSTEVTDQQQLDSAIVNTAGT